MTTQRINVLTSKVKKAIKTVVKKKTVLFVCTGNTCRSPMAEQIFKNYLKEKRLLSKYYVESAGLSVKEDKMSALAIEALNQLEVRCANHIPRQLDIISVTSAYRVICMERIHKDMIVRAVGDLPHIKTMDEITGRGDILDPYGTDFNKYIETAKKLIAMSEMMLENLQNSLGEDEENSEGEGKFKSQIKNIKNKILGKGKENTYKEKDEIDSNGGKTDKKETKKLKDKQEPPKSKKNNGSTELPEETAVVSKSNEDIEPVKHQDEESSPLTAPDNNG